MNRIFMAAAACVLFSASEAWGGFVTFEAAGADAAAITPTRDAFRGRSEAARSPGPTAPSADFAARSTGTAYPAAAPIPTPFPPTSSTSNSPRGVVFSTPGTGFLVSANAGVATPPLFGFPNDFQTFSPQKLFTAVNSNITDVNFFVPGTTIAATTSAFGVIFVDVEVAGADQDRVLRPSNNLIFSRDALVARQPGA